MVYKWYILPIGGLYATYHLLGEPETTIDSTTIPSLKLTAKAPENRPKPKRKLHRIPTITFQGLLLLVSGSVVCKPLFTNGPTWRLLHPKAGILDGHFPSYCSKIWCRYTPENLRFACSVVGKKHSPNDALMVIYHGRKQKNTLSKHKKLT